MSSFIGREKEIAELKVLLGKTRLLTLTGSGGCGKTRLALRLASDALEQFPDGVWFVDLAPLSDPTLLAQQIASTLGIKEQAGQPIQQTLSERLQSRSLLLVLDNCEHIVAMCAQLAAGLLSYCLNVKVLTTSREALNIAGEQIHSLPSLSFPDLKQTLTPQSMSQYEAVRLYIDRATQHKADFVVSNQNASALAEVCQRLDGIPLAIELAAARTRTMSVVEINTRLDDRFRLLTGGDRTALPRHKTLRAAIDWSYDLLSEQERLLLARLSVFAGGWMLVAAEQVCSGESIEDWEVLGLLTSLVDKSLVIAETQGDVTRYRMLETIRQYAHNRLVESFEHDIMRGRHRDYFLMLAEKASPKLRSSEQEHWLAMLEHEHDNLRQGLRWCLEEPEGAEKGLRLGAALQQFWWIHGHLSEGREHLTTVLSRSGAQEHTSSLVNALNGAGILARQQSDYASARSLFEESLAISRELADKSGIARSLNNLGIVASDQGDYASAHSSHEESLAISRELEDKSGIARSLNNLGEVAFSQGDYASAHSLFEGSLALKRELGDKSSITLALENLGNTAYSQGDYASARSLFEESLAISRELGAKSGIARSLNNLGVMVVSQGDYASGRSAYEESLAISRELGDKTGIARSLNNLGEVAFDQGDYASARSAYEESLAISRELKDKSGIAYSIEAIASLAFKEQDVMRAVRLWSAAIALREAISSPLTPNEQAKYEQLVIQARSALGEDAFNAAWEEGRAMAWEQAVKYALETQN